jgi:choline dehydrogenase-like flavoprotein
MASTPKVYDVCIVGSGAAGGIMAKELTEGGAQVVQLEGGKRVAPSEFLSHKWPYELPYRGLRNEKQNMFYQGDVRESIRYHNSDNVHADRMRVLGGRTVHWNAVTLRYAARDFREWSLEGIEDDWPISYEEIAPHYDRIEAMIGVCGQDDGLEILPGGSHYLPPLPWRQSERILQRAANSMGIPVIPVRKALLTKPFDGRPPCHHCGHCMSGCDVTAIFNSAEVMIPKALATGNLTLRQNSLAREILVDDEGRAKAVSFIDTTTGKEEQVRARVVVLCAATVETARLLLNSRSPQHPHGLANSNDVVGRYLSGHAGNGINAYIKEMEGIKFTNQDGATDHVFIPRYNHLFSKTDYTGGWDVQVNLMSYMNPRQALSLPGYGSEFKTQVRRMQPALLGFGIFTKVMARPENRVTVDRHHLDAHGIPVPVMQFRFNENDATLWRESNRSVLEICDKIGCTVFTDAGDKPSGFASHEVGTVRMGKNPKTSVLNSYCQAHEVKNLFVTDGSSFTTSSEKNPTLTIMALSLRTSEYIKDQRRMGLL